VTNISQSFTYKMAAKINRHRYGTKYVTVTLCILKVGNIYLTTVLQSACLSVCLSVCSRISKTTCPSCAKRKNFFTCSTNNVDYYLAAKGLISWRQRTVNGQTDCVWSIQMLLLFVPSLTTSQYVSVSTSGFVSDVM